ncbi:MAG: sulfatase [Magnetococcales bacterium]|nr:sulfatase [Magnetococcales bacterium]
MYSLHHLLLIAFFGLALINTPLASAAPTDNPSADAPNLTSPGDNHQPNIIVLLVDTLRLDHTSLTDYSRNTTPNLKEFSEQAYLFPNAKAQSSWTLASVSSILTGQYPFHHGMNAEPDHGPDDYQLTGTLVGAFNHNTDYHTLALLRNYITKYLVGDFREKIYHTNLDPDSTHSDASAVDEAIDWIADWRDNENFFMFLALLNPHWPYNWSLNETNHFADYLSDDTYLNHDPTLLSLIDLTPVGRLTYTDIPPNIRWKFDAPNNKAAAYQEDGIYIAAYDAEIRYADSQVGKLMNHLKKLGVYDKSMIVILADHGELMTEQADASAFSHGDHLYNAELSVPFMIKFPHQTSQQVIEPMVRTMDLLPTLLDYLGVEIDTSELDARSLMPILRGERVNYDERPIISSTELEGTKISIYKNGMHLINYVEEGTFKLFDINEDPLEHNNLADSQPELRDSLWKTLCKYYCE